MFTFVEVGEKFQVDKNPKTQNTVWERTHPHKPIADTQLNIIAPEKVRELS